VTRIAPVGLGHATLRAGS